MGNSLHNGELETIVEFVKVTKDKKPAELRKVAEYLNVDLEEMITFKEGKEA